MTEYSVNQIVKGRVAGTFVILAMRELHGEAGVQLKEVNPRDFTQTAPGEMWLPLTAIEPIY